MRSYLYAFFLILFTSFTPIFAETEITGTVENVRPAGGNSYEIQVRSGGQAFTYTVTEATVISAKVPVKRVKKGQSIFWPDKSTQGSSGYKAPFSTMPRWMKKKLHLADMPQVPEVPNPKAMLPKVPKPPKTPQLSSQQSSQETKPPRVRSPLPVAQPTEEEKNLFGRGDAAKPLLPGMEETPWERKVLDAAATQQGIELQVEGSQGEVEKILLPPDRSVLQRLHPSELQDNMSIRLHAVSSDDSVASEIQVLSLE